MDSTNQMANQMTLLLNKIERRLGLKVMQLPADLAKDSWPQIIIEDTLPTFSRYFPYEVDVIVDNSCMKDGFYFIDCLPALRGAKIIGVRDVDFQAYRADPRYEHYGINFSTYDFLGRDYTADDVGFTQVHADLKSLFNFGIYVEFKYPNKIKLVSVSGAPISKYRPFPLKVFIEHPANLMTISPTMMEIFERLAIADVATFLFHQLKYYDGTDTGFVTVDLKLNIIEEWANKRDDIVRELDENHVTTANEYQPIMLTI